MTLTADKSWQEILGKRVSRLPGLLAPSSGVLKGAVRDRVAKSATDIETDAGRMTMTATISTPDEDRSDDIVHQLGIKLDRYKLNPICYFDHGQEFTLPIGKSADDDNNLTVSVSEAGTVATCFFPSPFRSPFRSSRSRTKRFCGPRQSTFCRSSSESVKERDGESREMMITGRVWRFSNQNCWSGGRSEFPTTPTP